MKVNNLNINARLLGTLLLLLLGCDTSDSIAPDYENYFVKYYGEEGRQEGVDLIVNTEEETVILLGRTILSSDPEAPLIFLVKVDYNGNVIWKKTMGAPGDIAKDIEFANDGGYVILSETKGNGGSEDVKLTRINTDGEEIKSVIFGSPSQKGVYANETPVSVTPVGNGYIVTGSSDIDTTWASESQTQNVLIHVRFSNDLVFDDFFQWMHRNSENSFGIKTVQLSQGGLYSFGSSDLGATSTNYNFWYFGLSPVSGLNNEEDHFIGNDSQGINEQLYVVCPAISNGYFMVGTYSNNSSTSDMYAAQVYEDNGKLKKAQGEKNIKIPGKSSVKLVPVSVCQSHTGPSGYLVLSNAGDPGSQDIWLCKISDSDYSQVYWSSSFGAGELNNDSGGAVAELPDGRILILGTVNLGSTNFKMALLKLNANGKLAK